MTELKNTKYILFLYSLCQNEGDAENICLKFSTHNELTNCRFIIENKDNIIIIFESRLSVEELYGHINDNINTTFIKFYYMFNFNSILSAQITGDLKSFIFNENGDDINLIKLTYDIKKPKKQYNYDELMDKVRLKGPDFLSDDEKNFLDNYFLD